MARHKNLELFARIYTAFSAGDMEALAIYFSDGVVWHTPGANPLAGIYTGKAEAFGSFTREAELSNGTYTVAVRQVLANDTHIVALLHATAQRQDRTLDQDYAIIFRLTTAKSSKPGNSGAIKNQWMPSGANLRNQSQNR
jgi:ketosteroid isomerase-like protein